MFINLSEADNLTENKVDELYKNHFNNALYNSFKLTGLDIHFERAQGMYLWDKEGNKYMDFTGGFGALNLGHNHPRVIAALTNHFNKPNLAGESINIYNGVLANNISSLTNYELPFCHFTNSGTETVEEALKLAQMYKGKGIVIYCSGGYHGKTLGSISALGNKVKENYNYFYESFIEVPFEDYNEFEKVAKKHKVAAFLVEPIQGEAGIIIPPEGYFKKIREFCSKNEIILILDEIQTGLGRCGTMFFYEELGIIPDILCLSKPLGGGIIPIGCIAVKKELWDDTYGKLPNAGLLSTTYGGNTFACICAIETLSVIKDEKLPERAKGLGDYTISSLQKLRSNHKIITDIRGRGLLIGVELGGIKKYPGSAVKQFMISVILAKLLKEHRIMCSFASNSPEVLKIEPPLIVNKEEIDYFIESFDNVLNDEKGELSLAMDSIIKAGKEIIENPKIFLTL
ncbi:MAG: patA [Clostridiales bacterium]|nr:patA [Clostridiales bacterium]